MGGRSGHPTRYKQSTFNIVQGVPKRGLYAIDTLKHLSGLTVDEMQVIGIDPGMIDLIHCVDPDRILETQPIGESPASLVYTAARRKHETCSVLYRKRMEEEKSRRLTYLPSRTK